MRINMVRKQRLTQAGCRPALICVAIAAILFGARIHAAQNPTLAEARRLIASHSYDAAARSLERSLQTNPRNAEAAVLLGQVYTIEGRRAEAIQKFTQALQANPASAATYNTLGLALDRFAEFELARTAFERAVALDPAAVQAHINLAMSLAQGEDLKGAREQLGKAIDLKPPSATLATAHYLLAKTWEDESPQLALKEAETSTTLNSHDEQAWLELGGLDEELGDQKGAIRAFERAVGCSPGDAEAQYSLGSEYLEVGDANRAVTHLYLARKAMPTPTIALLYKLDRALRATGAIEDAKRVRKEVQALIVADSDANRNTQEAQQLNHDGIELEQQGQSERAMEKFKAALELNPQQNNFRYNYALALCHLGRMEQGIAELNELLQNDPGNIDARRALFIAKDKAKTPPRSDAPAAAR